MEKENSKAVIDVVSQLHNRDKRIFYTMRQMDVKEKTR